MEHTVKNRGGGRNGLYISHEAWTKAGKPDHYVYDSKTGRGHVKTPEERRLDEVKAKRFEMRTRRSAFHRRLKLEKLKAELAAGK